MFRLAAALLLAALFAGCASAPNRAPVEERPIRSSRPATAAASATPGVGAATAAGAASAAEAVKPPPPGVENAGKPGYYTVKPGDTLIRIGLENGQNWRDIARWNGLESPYTIEIGQVVRVAPPVPVATTQPVAPGGARVESRPPDGRTAPVAPAASAGTAAATSGATATSSPAVPRDPDDDISWAWPAAGPVLAPFDDAKNKGLTIGGKAGDPVYAAADGRVVYAGSGLRGYGNLIIVKHNNTYLTAYAHNQALLVKEDQAVRRGQKIAEMGSSDSDRVQLHFEIRRLGKPIDPAKLLPPR